jgi:ADP-ribose pyrophosphatase YjhB (NUDIX family)
MIEANKNSFVYCPKCGKENLKKKSEKSFSCSNCGFVFYLNVAAAVAAIITDEADRVLVAIRKNDPAKDTWDLPGGFVDANESIEECLVREIVEELNIEITEAEYFCSFPNKYKYRDVTYSTIDLTFICKVEDFSNLKAADDVKSYIFCPIKELKPENFGLESIKNIVSHYLSHRGNKD